MQVYFAYLYLGSIVFFVYVFGYLLKSKKKKEEKKRLRRLSRSRRISSMTSYESSEDYSDETQVSRNASVSMENEQGRIQGGGPGGPWPPPGRSGIYGAL